jgi:hypothetical protein
LLLRTDNQETKAKGHLKMLINEQTLPYIMWKMPVADKKQ